MRPTFQEFGFSDRETAILHHLTQGADNKLIAYDLGIPEAAIYAHIRKLCRKLGVGTRAQVAVWARDHEQLEG
jgi:two-component system, NarL family, nitrate/nitrite response regulator NarL